MSALAFPPVAEPGTPCGACHAAPATRTITGRYVPDAGGPPVLVRWHRCEPCADALGASLVAQAGPAVLIPGHVCPACGTTAAIGRDAACPACGGAVPGLAPLHGLAPGGS